MGGGMAESTRTSLRSGGSPSTLAVPPSGSDSRLAAKARAAAKEMRDDQRSVKAEMVAARQVAGTARARQRASKRTKLAASGLIAPAPSNFKRDDGEPAAVGTAELWVGALLGPPGCLEGCSSSLARDPARGTSSGEGKDQGGVEPGHPSTEAGRWRSPQCACRPDGRGRNEISDEDVAPASLQTRAAARFQEGEESLVGAQLCLDGAHGGRDSQRIQSRHQGIPLFAALRLLDPVTNLLIVDNTTSGKFFSSQLQYLSQVGWSCY